LASRTFRPSNLPRKEKEKVKARKKTRKSQKKIGNGGGEFPLFGNQDHGDGPELEGNEEITNFLPSRVCRV